MKAIGYVDQMLGQKSFFVETAAASGKRTDPMFVEVLVGTIRNIIPWLVKKGFGLVPYRMIPPGTIGFVNMEDQVMVTLQPAFGGNVNTDLPKGWPQRFKAVVTAGFVDMGSKSVARRVKKRRRKNPKRYHSMSTFSGWMRAVNGILLKEINLGSWQLVKQPYEQWFTEGMRPSTAANIVIDGVSLGAIKRKYKRRR
jgi:hypothetical protein